MKTYVWFEIYSKQLNRYLVIKGKDLEGKEYFQIPIFQERSWIDNSKEFSRSILIKLFTDIGYFFLTPEWSTVRSVEQDQKEFFYFKIDHDSDTVLHIKNYINTGALSMPIKETVWIDIEQFQKLVKKQIPDCLKIL